MSHLPNCKNSCRISWGPFFSLSRSWSLLALSCSTNSFRDKWFHISVVVFVVIIVGTFCTTASQLSSYVQTSPTFTLQITKFRFFLLFSFILCTSPVEVSIQININKLVKTYNATPDRESTITRRKIFHRLHGYSIPTYFSFLYLLALSCSLSSS